MNDKRLAEAFAELVQSSSDLILQPARLGRANGSGYDVVVADRPGWVYVSKGPNGDEGMALAWDALGVDTSAPWQMIKLRREHGRLVVREAEQTAGGGGGSSTLAGLSDIALTGLQDGEGLAYDSGTGKWINVAIDGGAGAPSPHNLSGVHHTGTLDWDDLNKTGSDLADLTNRDHGDLSGVTPDNHHPHVHPLVGNDSTGTAQHTASGLTTGHVVRASGSTSFAWAQLQHDDLGGVTANQHHNQVHNITGSDHTITGSQYDLVGAIGANTLGLLTPSSNPGASVKILRTDSNGSLQLDTNLLYVDAPNNRIGINQAPGGAALDIVASSNSDHTQRIKQKSGQLGRLWRIEDTGGDELIVLDSQGNLQSGKPGFVSGLTGWQITPTGTAEFNNVWVRGELHASVFVKDEIHATGGTMMIATAGKLYSDADIDSSTVDTETLQFEIGGVLVDWEVEQSGGTSVLEVEGVFNYIEIEDSPTGPGFYFQAPDVVRSKTEAETGVTDFWLEIVGRQQLDGYQRYSVIKHSGTDGILPAGAAVVSYGQPGDGRILLTSDLNYAPYMDVFNVGSDVWSGEAGSIVPRVRLGRLDGVGVTGTSGIEQYGIIMGTDLSNANSPYIVASNLQLRLHKVDLTLNDGTNDTGEWTASGNLKLGPNIGTTAQTTFSVQTTGTDAGDVIIGNHALTGNYLRWDQSAGTLSVSGALSVGGSSVATVTYVDNEIFLVDIGAQGYASIAQSAAQSYADGIVSTAQTAAQTYGNARRVVGVSGTFRSSNPSTGVVDADTIYWGNPTDVTVRFGDGRSVTINDGNTGNMSARTYIYMTATATGTASFSTTTSVATLGANHALIAVCDPGTDGASVSIVAGSTYISGDNIITGSIVAANIKAASITGDRLVANTITAGQIAAGTITGNEITGTTISAIRTNTGSLSVTGNIDMSTTGAIRGGGKTSAFSSTAGFFLGYESSTYRFGIGNSTDYLYWNGSSLIASFSSVPTFNTALDGSRRMFQVTDGVFTRSLTFSAGSFTIDPSNNTDVYAKKFVNTGNTTTIQQSRTIASYTSTGLQGEICWDEDYLYVCIATNFWRRIPLPVSTW